MLGGECLRTSVRTYKKIIVTNHVIEVYEYEKPPISGVIDSSDSYDPFDLETTKLEIEPREDRKNERRKQTVRDARNTTRRLALMNFNSGDKFITLTFKENITDINFADNEFKKFIKRFKHRFKLDSLKYIAVREFQKRGAIHYHMLCDWKENLLFEDVIREYERLLGEKIWKHGFVDIKQLDYVDNVGAYIIKYMTKNVAIEFFKGKKIYLCSKGLERPLVFRDYEAQQIIDQYNLSEKKEVFTNSYESEYLGKIVYREYNLKRL